MKNKKPKIYTEKCRYCGKEFNFLSKKQAINNREIHELFCKKKDKIAEEEK